MYRVESKEFTFVQDGDRLHVLKVSASVIDDFDVSEIIHTRCESSSQDKKLLGAMIFVFGLVLVYLGFDFQLVELGLFVGLIFVIIGVALLRAVDHSTKITFSLSNSMSFSYSTSKEKADFIELMNRLASARVDT